MMFYEVFGGILQSDIEFPELPIVGPQRPDWTLTRGSSLAPLTDSVRLGEEVLAAGVSVGMDRTTDRFRLSFDDTGTFDIASGGAQIVWVPAPHAKAVLVRSDVLGRVMAIALHAAGDLCLHGSVAAIGNRAVVLVGPKRHGKSTLVKALVADGARFIADDAARITSNPPRVALGVPTLRLSVDSAHHFGIEEAPSLVGDKVVLPAHDESKRSEPWIPLDAVYVVNPCRATPETPAVSRRRLNQLDATLTLVRQGKCGALLGKEEAGVVLARANALARQVPVFVLDVARDLSLLSAAAAQMHAWHAPAPRQASQSSSS
ncbi:MAG TPA: hypothetical protein VJO33_01605 [Gemmatimonadaceae bacterium]|nr:hypothetical protein [Gemmatimonadaceae bacterium]